MSRERRKLMRLPVCKIFILGITGSISYHCQRLEEAIEEDLLVYMIGKAGTVVILTSIELEKNYYMCVIFLIEIP
jgi:hypothetical protein